ncbi:GNAT family N-acetyltransferase [Alloacidobacterium dinghuense]|uniref:GNAT family N-acetyltransferase n=1 Tax=Alloacidobacterium dinghuense TaxID=2763107 RepID=A0A7G8BKQ3_9BACT|nr:N-acetyltransferase [Alloacidobacterium dinghuense]QNI33123.1 GNAT family N-acetyltransferase [Alloacidobacterium dinghuense]
MIQLRPFRSADLNVLYRIDHVCFAPGIAYSKAELRYYLQHPKSITVVAETESQAIAGFCTGQLQMREGRHLGHIITIDVLPDWRGQKVGRAMLLSVEEDFRAKGAESIRLEVAVDNLQAQTFYHAVGYSKIGMIPGYYAGKLDALVMEKDLTGDVLPHPRRL